MYETSKKAGFLRYSVSKTSAYRFNHGGPALAWGVTRFYQKGEQSFGLYPAVLTHLNSGPHALQHTSEVYGPTA